MAEITQYSYAKVNLTLDVLQKRPDSYHEVRMIMQTLKLRDIVRIKTDKAQSGITVETNLPYLPTDRRNLAFKAAELFFAQTGIENPGVSITLFKRIPVSAGLAGGSGNASAVLKGLNSLFEARLSHEKLLEMGLKLGADVPYCMTGGTALAEGIGEKLKPLRKMPHAYVVLVKPPFSMSTAAVYGALDSQKIVKRPDTAGALRAIEEGDLCALARRMYNVLFDVVRLKHRVVSEIRDELILHGALGAVMSGSGPSVFGLFENAEQAKAAYEALKKKVHDTFLTETENVV